MSSGLILFGFFAASQLPIEDPKISLANFLINFGLLIIGVNLSFKANGGNQGQHFLNRFLALYLPVSIRMSVYCLGFWIFIELWIMAFKSRFDLQFLAHKDQYASTVFGLATAIVMYWRIYFAIKAIQ